MYNLTKTIDLILNLPNQKTETFLFHSLDNIQREAILLFDFKAMDTLYILENLYEKGYCTYPRSDASYLTNEEIKHSEQILNYLFSHFEIGHYSKFINKNIKPQSFNSSKCPVHKGITITVLPDKPLENLTEDEFNLFKLICIRYIVQFIPNFHKLPAFFNVKENLKSF